jgi:hypothetical protein
MIRIAWRLSLVLAGLSLAGCADVNDFLFGQSGPAAGEIVAGVYHRTPLSGDLFDFPCRYGHVCRAVLVRDEYLRDHYVDLDGKKLVLRIERTNACHDPRSSQYACQSSPDGTALLILQWIRPEV